MIAALRCNAGGAVVLALSQRHWGCFPESMFKRLRKSLIVFVLLAGAAWWHLSHRPIRHEPGVLVPNAPVQKDITAKAIGMVGDWHVTAVAEYSLQGRVLGTKRYHSGPQADLVPVDVAVGWGRMSDQAVLDWLKISMANRFYFYEWKDNPPIPQDEIKVSSANNHVIAANDDVRKVIGGLRVGQIVTLKGWLVNANGPEGATWNTSLRRDDTGNGACEVFYVASAKAANSLSEGM
jgi:hypothetical protein